MSYTIYKNVQVLSVQQQEQQASRRTKDIADPTRERGSYYVTVARFAGVDYEATIADFKAEIHPGQKVSVAINDKWDVIAVVNHTTGHSKCLRLKKIEWQEVGSILFFLAFPCVLLGALAYKAFKTVQYHDAGYGLLAAGIVIVVLVLQGINKEFRESKKALGEML